MQLDHIEKYSHLEQAVAEIQDYAIITLDFEGNILTWNAGAERIKGYNQSQILGKNFRHFYTERDRIAGLPDKLLSQAIRVGKANDEGWRVKQDGTRFWAHVTITAIHGKNYDVVGFSKVTRDLTERKRTEEELKTANEELAQFAYRTSHDLKAPLKSIMSCAMMLQEDITAKDYDSALSMAMRVEDKARDLDKLVDDILDMTKADLEEQHEMTIDFEHIKSTTLMSCGDVAEEKNVVLEFEFATNDKIRIQANRYRQIINNLVMNGIKYSDPDKKRSYVKVTLQQDNDRFITMIEDNGLGIAAEYHPKVFDMFSRFHAQVAFGSGLGTAIVLKHVLKMNGDIRFMSEQGVGTTFIIDLPID